MGREKKDKMITFRLLERDKKALDEIADYYDIKVTEWLEKVIRRTVKRIRK